MSLVPTSLAGRGDQDADPTRDNVQNAVSTTLTPNQFREVMGQFASGVSVITTTQDGVRLGTTASAVTSLSLEPPMLVICMNMASTTCQAIATVGRFAVNILGEDQSDVAVRFAGKGPDRFSGVTVIDGGFGVPLLADALATLECRVVETVPGGTHHVFLAEVARASGRSGAPLAYFRGEFGRLELAQDESALRELRDRVLHRRIPIGQALDLDRLAGEVQAPRGSVYHALAKLSGEGLLDRDADGSFVVPPVTLDSLLDSARARLAIFVGAAALSLGQVSDAKIAELRRLLDAMGPRVNSPSRSTRGSGPARHSWTS